jgi:tetratricopeptide (TPR) repeat protein
MTRAVGSLAALCLVLASSRETTYGLPSQDVTSRSRRSPDYVEITYRPELIDGWVDAVLSHAPGDDDSALAHLGQWNSKDLRDAWLTVNVLIALLAAPERRTFSVPRWPSSIPVLISNEARQLLARTALELRNRPGREAFLKRAALLHSDAATVAGPDGVLEPFNTSFLLPGRVFVETGDGTQEGLRGGDVNWEFARTLLDGLPEAGREPAVESWYHATMAYLIDVEHYDNPHFNHALRQFPRSDDVQYFVGCLHEALSGPRVQSVRSELRVPPRTSLEVGSERTELNSAERFFRGALASRPDHHEARLRLGRVLARLGRHQEAASELQSAFDGNDEPLLRYYGALFLGAEEEALGRDEQAGRMYQVAAALFPAAQAPAKALSQLAHRRGDRMVARTILEPALAGRDDIADDPWWRYHVSCGRNADSLMQAAYRSMSGQPAGD